MLGVLNTPPLYFVLFPFTIIQKQSSCYSRQKKKLEPRLFVFVFFSRPCSSKSFRDKEPKLFKPGPELRTMYQRTFHNTLVLHIFRIKEKTAKKSVFLNKKIKKSILYGSYFVENVSMRLSFIDSHRQKSSRCT